MKKIFKSKAIFLILGIVGIFLGGGAAIIASMMLPDFIADKISSKMVSAEKRLDSKIEFASFERKGMFGGQITNLQMTDNETGQTYFKSELMGGAVSPWRLLRGKIAPTDLWLKGVELVISENEDGGFDLVDRLKNARKKTPKTPESKPKENKSSLISFTFLPELKATDISVRFKNQEDSPWPIQSLKIPEATIVENENYEIHTNVNIEATRSEIWKLPGELKVDIFVSDELRPVGGTIVGDTPVRISGIQPFPFLTAGFESISFNEEAQMQVNALTIDMGKPEGPSFFEAQTVALTPTHWNPAKGLGVEDILIEGPKIYDHIRKDGRSILYDLQNMFRPKAPRNVTQKAFDIVQGIAFNRDRKRTFKGLPPLVPEETDVKKAQAAQKQSNADIGDKWERFMRLLPNQFLIKNASATVKDDRNVEDISDWAELLEAKHGNLEFVHDKTKKEIRFDLGFDAFADREKRGKVSSLINWSYEDKKVNSDIKVEDLNLLWASQFLGKEVARTVRGGTVSADLSVKPEQGTEIQIRGNVAVSKLNVFHPSVAEEAIENFDATYKFNATYDPEGKIAQAKLLETPTLLENTPASSPLRKGSLVVESGEATVNGVPFVFRPKVFGTGAFPRLPARLDLFVELKRTPVQKLFEAVPKALLGPLKGGKFAGAFSWKLNVETPLKHAADMKWDSQTRTDKIRVNYLPNRVDVRRLLNDTKLLIRDTVRQRGKKHEFRRKIYIPTMRSPGDGFIAENMGITQEALAAHRAAHPIRGPSGNINSSAKGTDSHGYHRLTGISPYLIRAILTTEDKGFWKHSGISFWALRESLQANLNSGTIRRGGSTIAMQFVKNMFLDRKRIYARKMREVFLVYLMFHVVNVPRERILEIYFNIIEFGPKIYGIHEASVHYFGKRAIDLSLSEVAFLVSIIPGPKKWHYHWERGEIPDWWFRRMKRYIGIMFRAGRVTAEERDAAIKAAPLFWKPEPGGPRYRPKDPILPPEESETVRSLNEILNPGGVKKNDAPQIPTPLKPIPEMPKGKIFDPEL